MNPEVLTLRAYAYQTLLRQLRGNRVAQNALNEPPDFCFRQLSVAETSSTACRIYLLKPLGIHPNFGTMATAIVWEPR